MVQGLNSDLGSSYTITELQAWGKGPRHLSSDLFPVEELGWLACSDHAHLTQEKVNISPGSQDSFSLENKIVIAD